MKGIFKPAIPSAAVKIIIIMSAVVLLPQCNSREFYEMVFQYMKSRNDALAVDLKGRQDGYVRVLRTLANIMADYEKIPARERLDRYDEILLAVFNSEPEIAALFTVWKPDAVGGTDSNYRARPGSNPSGPQPIDGQVRMNIVTNADIDIATGYLYSPDSKKDHVDDPVPGRLNGRDAYLIRMSVPIVNRRTNETAGIVSCILSIDAIQIFLESAMRDYVEIAAMAVYSNNGFILASYVPERVGYYMFEVDTIYGDYIEDAKQAVIKGQDFYCFSYSLILSTYMEIFMKPLQIGNSDTTWSVMIASTEGFFKRRSLMNFR
jgi:methyl-accepting chemotaxis protein